MDVVGQKLRGITQKMDQGREAVRSLWHVILLKLSIQCVLRVFNWFFKDLLLSEMCFSSCSYSWILELHCFRFPYHTFASWILDQDWRKETFSRWMSKQPSNVKVCKYIILYSQHSTAGTRRKTHFWVEGNFSILNPALLTSMFTSQICLPCLC